MNYLSFIKAIILGAIFSLIAAWLFSLMAQTFAGGMTSFAGESWLYYSVIIPLLSHSQFWVFTLKTNKNCLTENFD